MEKKIPDDPQMTANFDELKLIELVYRSMGAVFALYADGCPKTENESIGDRIEQCRLSLVEDIGILQRVWSQRGKTSGISTLPSYQRQQARWGELIGRLERMQSRLGIWTSWSRRLTVLNAAERRLSQEFLQLVQDTPALATDEIRKVGKNFAGRVKVLQEVRIALRGEQKKINQTFVQAQKILNLNQG
jgi:hypothetical protein